MDDGRPEEPSVQDCCHSGCSPCVFDIYEKRLTEWKNNTLRASSSFKIRSDLLSETVFKPFILKRKTKEARDVWRFKFQSLTDELYGQLPYRAGQHVVLRHPDSSGDKFITRDYTLMPSEDDFLCGFTVVIKLYDRGDMSTYIGDLNVGSVSQWRGPVGDFTYTPNSFQRVVMICMGTGVAPMYAVAKEIVNNEYDETFVDLLYGCQSLDSVILRDELNSLMKYWNFRSWYCLSNCVDGAEADALKQGENFVCGRIDEKIIFSLTGPFEHCLVLICGSDAFNTNIKSKFCEVVPETNIFIF